MDDLLHFVLLETLLASGYDLSLLSIEVLPNKIG
jgi:hypothetical protein